MRFSFGVITTISVARLVSTTASDCVGTISSLDDVATAVQCTTVNLNSFTVPGGQALTLDLLTGTTVTMYGDIYFGNLSWVGPLFIVRSVLLGWPRAEWRNTKAISDDEDQDFWYICKCHRCQFARTRLFRVQSCAIVNDQPHCRQLSRRCAQQPKQWPPGWCGFFAGHNTDGFDCGTTNLVIENSYVHNQDDCLAINKGSNIVFTNNTCINGHGISVGSIASNVTVSDIVISGNTIIDNDQALRIKTDATATNSTISNITYAGNTATGMRQFGVLIDQFREMG
ncbi:unnamed protein product [Cyclocybe aegerita]|uniref:endo-polygalacturonase n=1 Tax=Cyclocybe aegerita TaxID=1973307 RepID=A0A8S0XF77_CYCAE|nr:unnamed protein product [Cyclocybe aegerita]